MAGTFPGIVGTQQIDTNGRPLRGATLTIFDAITNAAVSVFKDYGLTVPAANPVVADRSGRLPIVYVADGMYRLLLADVRGLTSTGGFDFPSVPSIGQQIPQPTNLVDPLAVDKTGDIKIRLDVSLLAGWVRMNGLTIGNTYSEATERANADCKALFVYAWGTVSDQYAPVIGGRGASAQADWAANKQLTIPSMRGRTLVGADGMGGARANVLTGLSTSSPDQPGSTGGFEGHQLTEAEMPAHNHGGGGNTGGQSRDHTHAYQKANALTSNPYAVAGAFTPFHDNGSDTSGGTSNDHTHSFSIPSDGGGQTHANMPPFMLGTVFWKL